MAERCLADATSLANGTSYSQLIAAVSVGRAALAQSRGSLTIAQDLYKDAQQLCKDSNSTQWEANAYAGLTGIYFHQRRLRDSTWADKKARRLAKRCGPMSTRLMQLSLSRSRQDSRFVPY